jgi:DNA-binding response OmpR family regulator
MAQAALAPVLRVVDDEPELRALLGECFGRHGFEARLAGDAVAARELIPRERPDLVILDVDMPGEIAMG